MKQLLTLLLLLPLFSFSQTYDELMSIDSKEKFVRTMVEIGYERISNEGGMIVYAYSPTEDDGEVKSTIWVYHFEQEDGGVVFLRIQVKNLFGLEAENNSYDKLFDVAKERCEYETLIENVLDESDEMVNYGCDWEGTGRMIAFSKTDGEGNVAYFYYVPEE